MPAKRFSVAEPRSNEFRSRICRASGCITGNAAGGAAGWPAGRPAATHTSTHITPMRRHPRPITGGTSVGGPPGAARRRPPMAGSGALFDPVMSC